MELLVLCCLLGGGLGLTLPPLELSLTIRLQDVARNIPTRCVEHSVTPVSCADVHNSDALVAHPDDCQLFYYCEESRSSPTCRQCPAGLHFNPTLHVCDWPQNAGCTAQAPPTTSTAAPTTDSPHNITKPTFNTTTPSVRHQNTTQPSNVTWSGVTPTIPPNTNTTATGSNGTTTTTAPPPIVSSTDSWPSNETLPNPGYWIPSNSSSNTNTTATGTIDTTTAPPSIVNSTDSWSLNETWAWATTTVPSNSTDAPASNNTAWESLNGNSTDDRHGNITEPPDTQNKSSDYNDITTPVSRVPTRTDRLVTDSTTSSTTSHQASSTRRSYTTSRPRNSKTSSTSAPTTISFRHTTLGWRLLN